MVDTEKNFDIDAFVKELTRKMELIKRERDKYIFCPNGNTSARAMAETSKEQNRVIDEINKRFEIEIELDEQRANEANCNEIEWTKAILDGKIEEDILAQRLITFSRIIGADPMNMAEKMSLLMEERVDRELDKIIKMEIQSREYSGKTL
jgi:hypothetical protein